MFYSPLVMAPDFDVKLRKADVAVLHVASNDLARKLREPDKLAELVLEKALTLGNDYNVKEVILMTCVPRGDLIRGTPEQFKQCRVAWTTGGWQTESAAASQQNVGIGEQVEGFSTEDINNSHAWGTETTLDI